MMTVNRCIASDEILKLENYLWQIRNNPEERKDIPYDAALKLLNEVVFTRYPPEEEINETILDSFKIQGGEVEMITHGGAGHKLIIALVNFYEANGGKNFFTTTFEGTVRNKRKRYEVTVRNLDGNKSPAEVIKELKDEIKCLKMRVKEHRRNNISDFFIKCQKIKRKKPRAKPYRMLGGRS